MNDLIKRFKENLQLAGYAKRSIDSYDNAVLPIQRFYNTCYNKGVRNITENEFRQYWV